MGERPITEAWGQDVEAAIQTVWLTLDRLGLANAKEIEPHGRGLLECKHKLDALLRREER